MWRTAVSTPWALMRLPAWYGYWTTNGFNPYLSYLALVVAAVLAGFVVGPPIERFLLRYQYEKDEVVILLITYGLFLILEDVIKLIWGVNPYFVSEPYELLGNFEIAEMSYPNYYLLMVGLALVVGLDVALCPEQDALWTASGQRDP